MGVIIANAFHRACYKRNAQRRPVNELPRAVYQIESAPRETRSSYFSLVVVKFWIIKTSGLALVLVLGLGLGLG